MMVVYKIINIITKDEYVGSAINFEKRRWVHLCELRKNKHHSPILQNSWNKYGEISFEFIIIEGVYDKLNLIPREQFWIDSLNPRFNISKTAGSPLGVKHTQKARSNMRKSHLGKKLTKESIQKRSVKQSGKNHWNYGNKIPDERKEKMRNGLADYYLKNGHPSKGISKSNTQRKKISNSLKLYFKINGSHRKGKKQSKESVERQRQKVLIPIVQFSLDNKKIKEWLGAKIASKELKINASNICMCCQGKIKTAGGFIWKYKKM